MRKLIVAVTALVLLASLLFTAMHPVPKVGILSATEDPEGNLSVEVGALQSLQPPLEVFFSEQPYFSADDRELILSASLPDAEIYYTTNGSEPSPDNKASQLYTEPVELYAPRATACIAVKAAAFAEGKHSETVTHSYFTGSDISTRFDTLIFSLTTDRKNLYDFDTGIFVPGRLREEYLAENPGTHPNPTAPANYNLRGMEGERPVYVECFTADGHRVVAQNAGLRIHGGWSRDSMQKSLKLIARKSYEPEKGMFDYDFFPDDAADDDYDTPILSYDTLVLRNGANDRNFGVVRNEVAAGLAEDWGFTGVSPFRPAAVYLNGEYFGFAMLQLTLEEHYLEDLLDAPTDNFDIVGNGEEWYESDDTEAVDDLMALRELADLDLTKDENYQKVTDVLDVDNMLRYYAFEVYMGNDDWPNNNLKRWRYAGTERGEGLHPWLDGRWRYLMYDLDWTLGLYTNPPDQRTFQAVLGGTKDVPLLGALLKRPELAERFANLMCDLTAYLSPAQVKSKTEEVFGAAAGELMQAMMQGRYDHWVNFYSIQQNHDYMAAYAEHRSAYILDSLKSYFGYEDMYGVEAKGPVRIGTQNTGAGEYFKGLSVTLSADLPEGKAVDYWLLNGERREGETLTVSDANAAQGTVRAELVLKDLPGALRIISAEYRPEWNGCVLRNDSGEEVNLLGLYLSDNAQQLKRWAFPELLLAPGQSVTLSGSNYADIAALYTMPMSFNLQAGEVLILSDEDGKVLDHLRISWQ